MLVLSMEDQQLITDKAFHKSNIIFFLAWNSSSVIMPWSLKSAYFFNSSASEILDWTVLDFDETLLDSDR